VSRDRLYLKDLLIAADRILEYTVGGEAAFKESPLIQDAVIRNFEIIGEAAKQISEETRTLHPDIPWRVIGRFRDLLIHHYHGVDLDQVWNIVAGDLQLLRTRAQEVLVSGDPASEGSDA